MNRPRIRKIFRILRVELAVILLSVVTIIALIPVFTYLYFAKDLTTKESIMNRNNTGVMLLDRTGKPFFTLYDAEYKEFVPLVQIPKHLQNAVITGEDREFYQHEGFSIRGILRSLVLDIKEGEVAYGGSTITQQLVKNSFLSSRKSFIRKYQEIILAQELERRFSKPEILEMYLNSVYFGEGAFGIQQAAKTYFGKTVSELTLAESALLAGILPAPSEFSPRSKNGNIAKQRQEYILREMRELGYISEEERNIALQKQLVYKTMPDDINSTAAHFAFMVRDQLIEQFGEERISRSGFRVKTTLDLSWQEYAEGVVSQHVTRLAGNNVTNGAAVVIDPKTGEIKVLVGSKDWFDNSFGKVNVATTLQSPGSAFKPLMYAAAFEKRLITPATPLQDRPRTFAGNYRPQNYDRKFRGTVLVRRALANSLNVPSVEIMDKLGVPAGLEMAKRLGITTLKDASNYGPSLVLGTGEVRLVELTNAYATFANDGVRNDITAILSITDKNGETVYTHKPKQEQAVDAGVAYLITSILSDNRARAEVFGNALTTSIPAAVKTGTAEDYRDALTVGYTPRLAVGVWVGNNDNKPMDQIAGSLGAAPIWRSLIEHFSEGVTKENFTQPENVVQTSVCTANGLLARNGSGPAYTEYFLTGTAPTRVCFRPRPTRSKSQPSQQDDKKEDKKEEQEKEENRGGPQDSDIDRIQQEVQQKIEEERARMEEEMKKQLEEMQNNNQQQNPGNN